MNSLTKHEPIGSGRYMDTHATCVTSSWSKEEEMRQERIDLTLTEDNGVKGMSQ